MERVKEAFLLLKDTGRDGFTLDAKGNEVIRDSGYGVGIFATSINEGAKYITSFPNRYLGFWRDGMNEYVDIVRIEDDIDVARHYAKQNKQVSFYDFENGEVIYV
jgi:hypothetical protein